MTWRYTKAGSGLCVDGPLTVEDWRAILGDILDEMVEQAKREAERGQ